MKILFVCIANVGRSQVAEAYFKTLSKHEAISAGTQADELLSRQGLPSSKLKDAPSQRPVNYMKQYGVDVSESERTQLTPEMVSGADRVIVIAEKETWPDYLVESEKVVFWDIPDALGMNDEDALAIYERVRERVEELVREVG